MDAHAHPESQSQRCPTCGAELSGASWFCGSCGSLLATIPASAMSDTTRPIAAVVPGGGPAGSPGGGANAEPATPTTVPPGGAATARRCARCGASNSLEARRCVACGAELAPSGEMSPPPSGTEPQTGERGGPGRLFKPR